VKLVDFWPFGAAVLLLFVAWSLSGL